MIYSRNTYTTENLTESDFRLGLGYDLSLLNHLRQLRNIEREKESYYLFTHTNIEGKLCEERFHPILGKVLINKKTLEKVIIESLHKHWLLGNYWFIVYRKEGTRSHGTLWVKNINSIDKIVLEAVREANDEYYFEEKGLTFDNLL